MRRVARAATPGGGHAIQVAEALLAEHAVPTFQPASTRATLEPGASAAEARRPLRSGAGAA